jgi:hypothetical protein
MPYLMKELHLRSGILCANWRRRVSLWPWVHKQGRAPYRNSDVTRFCHTHSYARALRGRGNCVCLTLLPHLSSFSRVLHSYLTYSVLATRTTSVSDSTAAVAFNRNNVEKVKNVYLPSLMMKVPDHLYVLGETYTCHMLIKYNQYA